MKKKIISLMGAISFSVIFTLIIILYVFNNNSMDRPNRWQDYLNTPTMINKINGDYFIMDCWNGRVIYNNRLSKKIDSYDQLTNTKGGHTIDSDGDVLVLDDSDNNKIQVFLYNSRDNKYAKIQEIPIEYRPHYIYYDNNKKLFYVLSSNGEISIFNNIDNNLCLVNKVIIPMVQYSRSLSIIDNYMYIPDGCNGNIFKVDYLNNWDLIEVYTVPNDIAGLNYITKIDDYFYLTTTCGYEFDMSKSPVIVRAKSIDEICDNNYENITSQFNLNGIPYYITYFDKHYFLSVIDPENQNGICQFDIKNNHIKNVKYIMNFETVDDISKIRKEEVFN